MRASSKSEPYLGSILGPLNFGNAHACLGEASIGVHMGMRCCPTLSTNIFGSAKDVACDQDPTELHARLWEVYDKHYRKPRSKSVAVGLASTRERFRYSGYSRAMIEFPFNSSLWSLLVEGGLTPSLTAISLS